MHPLFALIQQVSQPQSNLNLLVQQIIQIALGCGGLGALIALQYLYRKLKKIQASQTQLVETTPSQAELKTVEQQLQSRLDLMTRKIMLLEVRLNTALSERDEARRENLRLQNEAEERDKKHTQTINEFTEQMVLQRAQVTKANQALEDEREVNANLSRQFNDLRGEFYDLRNKYAGLSAQNDLLAEIRKLVKLTTSENTIVPKEDTP